MSNVYDALLRHPLLLTAKTTIVGAESEVNEAWAEFVKEHGVCLQTWDLLTANAWREAGISDKQITYGMPEGSSMEGRVVIVIWPKAKDFARSLISMISQTCSHCYVVAANDAGGKSVNSALKAQVSTCNKLDSARHCSLWSVELVPSETPHNWLREARSVRFDDHDFMTLPGVFGHGKLDAGTALLLEHVPAPGHGRVLDIGCGSGIIGLTMKSRNDRLEVTLSDVDAFAIRSAQLNSMRLGMTTEVIASDGLDGATGRYDIIFSNPPFHQGKRTDYEFARKMFANAHRHLTRDGQLWIVANRHLAYEDWAKEAFRNAEVMVQSNGFKVICVSDPV